jgi:hypothetical protein
VPPALFNAFIVFVEIDLSVEPLNEILLVPVGASAPLASAA